LAACGHSDLNRLVMDYLVIEGYKDAAEHFARESGLVPQVALDSIEDRTTIRDAIHRGDIEEAIERVNDLDPDVSISI
jgi:predicted AAA+ superfamily ATPase